MQTRKRAKSVTFGKKPKEKESIKESVKKTEPLVSTEKVAEKAEVVERRTVSEKPQVEELSETPPKEEQVPEAQGIVTPPSEFITENPLSGAPEVAKISNEPVLSVTEPEKPAAEFAETPQPIEPVEQQITPEQHSQELSPTLPQSAFTIQSTGTSASISGEGKNRFFVYFLVVAFLSFILGLGAMAGVSYLGLVKVSSLPRFPSGIKFSGLPGVRPTATPIPLPTSAPTQKQVDLQAYSISILNGSGITGKAADVKSTLTTAGFKISSTGNADKSTYAMTEISAKKSVDSTYLSKLEDVLKKSFSIDTTVATIPDSTTTDLTITIGSKTAQ